MIRFLFVLCLLFVLNHPIVMGGAIFSDNNAIENECKEMGAPRCVFAHVWLIGGRGDKCIVDFNAAEESTCTVKCSNITARIRCNMENDKCEWVEPKPAEGQSDAKKDKNDDGFCKRKSEMKSFLTPVTTPPAAAVVPASSPVVVSPDLAAMQQQMMQQQMLMMQQQQASGMAMTG